MFKFKVTGTAGRCGFAIVFAGMLASHALAQNLGVTLLQKGTNGTLVGVPNVQVARHNPATGAFVEARATDVNGVADFGNIGSARTTVSIIVPDIAANSVTFKRTVALVNVPTANIKFRVDDEDLENEASLPVLATFNVGLTNIPGNVGTSTSMNLSGGNYFNAGPTGQFNAITVGPANLDASGKFNIVVEARDMNSVLACGSALALDPASVNGTTVTIPLNSAPIQIPFTTTPSNPVRIGHNVTFLRNSVRLEGGHGHTGPEVFQTSGNLVTCPVTGFENVGITARNAADNAPAHKQAIRTFLALPASVDFNFPDRSIDTLSRSGATLQWTASGTAAADGNFITLEWTSGANQLFWNVIVDPTATSVTLPTLPGAFADRNIVPPSGVAVELYQFGVDSVVGYDAFLAAVNAADGSLLNTIYFNAANGFLVYRALSSGPVPVDFDGDGKTDIAVYRSGTWFILKSSGGTQVVGWGGAAQDIPVPADYDGDGKTDVAVYRDGAWFIIRSTDNGITVTNWGGLAQDIPVPADYDGDGKTDVAVYRDGVWFIIRSTDNGITVTNWGGLTQDIPVPADYDGDGKTDVAVYRDGAWFIIRSTDNGITVANWGGLAQDIPVPADYDGDGKTDVAVYRDGAWFIIRSTDNGITVTNWGGLAQDIPVPADYDGDGKTDVAVFRDGVWFILNSSGGTQTMGWGTAGDIPIN